MLARQSGLGREEFGTLTLRELFREFVVGRQRRKYEYELASLQAYQTVRIGLMVKRTKRTVKMPRFADVIGASNDKRIDQFSSHEKARAVLQMMAAAAGVKVRRMKGGTTTDGR